MAQTAEYLTSTLNGMKIEAKDATSVVDKFAAVGANTATSFEEISEAMSQTASSAGQAGVSLDSLISFIGTVSAATRQSASRIGVSFKTIFERMTKLTNG